MVTADDLTLKSNQESGNGYSDLIFKKSNGSAVIMEFKRCEDNEPITRVRVCADALIQIEEKQYDSDLRQRGCTEILKYGIAFYGKSCTVKMAEQDQK